MSAKPKADASRDQIMTSQKKKISNPDTMMFHARALQELVKSFDTGVDPSSNAVLFEGQFIAGPVLLTFAMEVQVAKIAALKSRRSRGVSRRD